VTGFSIPDEARSAAVDAFSHRAEWDTIEETMDAVFLAALSAWGAKEEMRADSFVMSMEMGDGSYCPEGLETRICTPWVPSKGDKP
jgi:hypothetical protein